MTDLSTYAIAAPPPLRALALLLLGLILGSFLHASLERRRVRRTSKVDARADQAAAKLKRLDLWFPRRSFCFACGTPLAWFENIPLGSYLYLRGRCRHCGVPYSAKAFWMELGAGLGLALGGWWWPFSWSLLGGSCLWLGLWSLLLQQLPFPSPGSKES